MLVMSIMIATPFMQTSMWMDEFTSVGLGLETVAMASVNAGFSDSTYNSLRDYFIAQH